MKKFLLFIAAFTCAGIKDDPLWPKFSQEIGIEFITNKYGGYLSCDNSGDDKFICTLYSQKFKVIYRIIKNKNNFLDLISSPELVHYDSLRYYDCNKSSST